MVSRDGQLSQRPRQLLVIRREVIQTKETQVRILEQWTFQFKNWEVYHCENLLTVARLRERL